MTFDPLLCFIAIGVADSIPENEFQTRKNDGGYYLLSPCLLMTIFEILIAVIIKTDNDNLKRKKNDINCIHEMRMNDETSNWFDTGKTTVQSLHILKLFIPSV